MLTHRSIALSWLVVFGCVQGCGSSSGRAPSHDWQPANAVQKPVVRQADQMDANAGAADVLAQKTKSYAQEMSQKLQAHGPTAQPPTSAPLASVVKWDEPAQKWPETTDLKLGLTNSGPGAASPAGATIQPVVDTTQAHANSPTAKDAVAMANVQDSPLPSRKPSPASPDQLESRFATRIKEDPRDVWAHMEYQLLRLLQDESSPELSSLATLPSEDREVITSLIDGLSNFRNALRADNNVLLSAKIRPVLEMADRLRSQADMTIPTIALCTKVDSFGRYDPIEPARFTAGVDHPVVVYCEVANFLSNLNDKQKWETRLNWEMTLYTEQSMPVWSMKTEPVVDDSRVRRHDFFIPKIITLPHTLPIGRYLLKVTIVDTQSNHVAEATVPLVIAAE